MSEMKRVMGVHAPGSRHWVGDGFHVRNMFPSNAIGDELNPFIMLDYAGPTRVAPSTKARGVDQHPHRGFETVTIAYQGAVEHRDSGGNAGTIYPGDVQWMTAASGVLHEEKYEREFTKAGGVFEMVQLWVNLPKAHKMSAPCYQTLTKESIPNVELGTAGVARVIAGELQGKQGPAKTFTPVNLWDLHLKAGGKTDLALPAGHHSAILLLRGQVTINGLHEMKGEAQIAQLSKGGDYVTVAATEDSVLLVLSGEPIDEPVVSYGPFVMNSKQEILQAMEDYNAGRMGRLD